MYAYVDERYQVTISDIQNWTGIKLDRKLVHANPLFFFDEKVRNKKIHVSSAPERIPVSGEENIVSNGKQRRQSIAHLRDRRIVINSAMINPIGKESNTEWVSHHNRGNRKTNISGWRLVDRLGREAGLKGSIGAGESAALKAVAKGKVLLSNTGGS